MGFGEAVAQAFKLFVLVAAFAFERVRSKEERIEDWRGRQASFAEMVQKALIEIQTRAIENNTGDADDAVDAAIKKQTTEKK